jgi:hypothetical protein
MNSKFRIAATLATTVGALLVLAAPASAQNDNLVKADPPIEYECGWA